MTAVEGCPVTLDAVLAYGRCSEKPESCGTSLIPALEAQMIDPLNHDQLGHLVCFCCLGIDVMYPQQPGNGLISMYTEASAYLLLLGLRLDWTCA